MLSIQPRLFGVLLIHQIIMEPGARLATSNEFSALPVIKNDDSSLPSLNNVCKVTAIHRNAN